MIRLFALWTVILAAFILLVVLREEYFAAKGAVPMGRLRRLWFRIEQRRAPRYRVNWEIRYARRSDRSPLPPLMRDISQTGAGLTVEEKLPIGSLIELELILPGHPKPIPVTGEVVWLKEVSAADLLPGQTRRFFIGVEFRDLNPAASQIISKTLRGNRGSA